MVFSFIFANHKMIIKSFNLLAVVREKQLDYSRGS